MTDEEKAAAAAAAKVEAEKAAAEKAKADQEAADRAAADKAKPDAEAEAAKAAEAQKLADLQAKLDAANAAVAKFEGLDPEAARAAIKAADEAKAATAEAEKEKLKAEGNFERLREIQQAESAAAITAAEEARKAAETVAEEANNRLNKALVETAFANSKFLQDETILNGQKAQRLFGDHVEIEDGKVVVYDKPAGEARRAKVMDSKGNALPFNEAIKSVIEADDDKDDFIRTKVTPGAGSKTQDGKVTPAAGSRHERLKQGIKALRDK